MTLDCGHDDGGDDARSDALLGDIEPRVPLARYLRCPRSSWDFVHPARTAPPPLLVDVDRFACYSDAKLPLLLRAVDRVQQRSRAFQSRAMRKVAFWTRVFPQHARSRDLQLGIERWMFEHAAFPRIVLSFHQMEVTAARLDMLLAFLTASDEGSASARDDSRSECADSSARSSASLHAPSPRPALEPTELPAIGLRFTQCAAFGTESLELLHRFLDRLFAHPRRRFAVHSLDLSHNQMNAAQLEVLRSLLEQNARVYHIASVKLNDIVFSRERESDEADALTTVLRVVFREALAPHTQLPRRSLAYLSLDHASLRLQHFATMCSAWRYGCDVVELSLLSTLNRVSAADRQQCWRWLAFGLFYPRSARAAEAFRLTKLDLSRIELRVADAKAFKQTLLDPARELVFHGQCPSGSGDGAAVSALKRVETRAFAAGVRVFEHPRESSRCVAVLACDRALEVLATTADGWVCVVYPGVGLGWTRASESVGLDSEVSSSSSDSSVADQHKSGGRNEEQHAHLLELTLHRLSSKKAPLTTLVECVGRHAQLLSLKYNTLDLDAIRLHCAHVAHLDIEGCHVQARSLAALVADTRFLRQLESLNLSDMALRDTDVRTLCQTLSAREPSMRLCELRLVSDSMSAQALASVRALLSANKTLAVLELPRLSTTATDADAACREIDVCHQDELLAIVKAQQTAVALLSVLARASAASRGGAAQSRLDADSIASILTFAGAPVRRRIMWRDSSSNYEDD